MSTYTHRQAAINSREVAATPDRTIEIAVVLMLLVTLFAAAWLSGRSANDLETVQQVRVESGDTLWSLAEAHPMPGKSTAETVRVLMELNDIADSTLVAGTVLDVPDAPQGAGSALAMR